MIPKIVHFSWIDDSILNSNHIFPKNTIQKMIELSPSWKFNLSTDKDIDDFLKSRLDNSDYSLIEHCHIVEKSDIWRLMKLYEEGGLYTDIDRLCNTPLDDIVDNSIMCILPTCLDNDFSQDFMCSAPHNPIFLHTFKLLMERRKTGWNNTHFLGPQTYMHGVTMSLFGKIIDANPGLQVFNDIRKELDNHPYILTYREESPYNTVLYRPKNKKINFDHECMKRDFYASSKIKHWTGDW